MERARLVSALASLPSAAKWLQAPSGTGKSTLAASYARSRNKALVWYRLDERDNDPVFFYAHVAHAIQAQLRPTAVLRKFSGDDHDRQHDFAQRFATALTLQLAQPTLIVLDDVQRITSEEMQLALAALVAVGVNGNELLYVSESTAPAVFFDAIASRQLTLLNDADLRFDGDECKAMTSALRIAATQSDSIAALTGGHAGALVLACELLRGTDPKSALGVVTVERIHSHLLTKLVERMPPPRREVLLGTAFVTQLTRSIAEALAGFDAAQELDALVESGLLRRVGEATNEEFEAHGLVQQGMQALVRARLGKSAALTLADLTASVLIANDQREAAFALLVDNGLEARALETLEQLAEYYAARGQSDLLLISIAKLPAVIVQSNAWLCFWTGQALLRVDEEQARVWLAHGYSAFEVSGHRPGMRLAASSIVTAFGLECGDLRELDLWIGRHRDAGGDTPIETVDRFETSLLMGIICAAFVYSCYPPQIRSEQLIARMRFLLDADSAWLSDDQRVQAARILVEHARLFGSYEQARSFIVATRALIDGAVGGALHRGRWLIAAAQSHYEDGDTAQSIKYLNDGRLIAEQSNSPRLFFELGIAFSDHWMKAHDLERAAGEMLQLEAIARVGAPAQRAEYARMMARLLLLQQHLPEGLRWAEEAMRIAPLAGFTGANLRTFELELVYALAANDRLAEAVDLVSHREFVPREVGPAVEYCLRFLVDANDDMQMLGTGLQNARQVGFVNLLNRARAPLGKICEAALANQIETDFVLRVIAVQQLTPPPLAGAHWPWPVHVRTLGAFRLDIQGERYSPSHKVQDKPLELLKLLVTCQALGRTSADKNWIAERLWPDAESANARKSLDMTLARLRRLLRCEDAVVANEGRLQLSPVHVWTDINPLRQALTQARLRRDALASGEQTSVSEAAASITAVLEHYSGPYLADEEGPAWVLAGKEAIAAMVRRALVAADTMLDGSADELLIPALEKAFAADPTSEDLARSLMRAHLRHGSNSETIRIYRRLREMLSLLLGVVPSAESDDIRDLAYAAELKSGQSTGVAEPQPSSTTSKKEIYGDKTSNTRSVAEKTRGRPRRH